LGAFSHDCFAQVLDIVSRGADLLNMSAQDLSDMARDTGVAPYKVNLFIQRTRALLRLAKVSRRAARRLGFGSVCVEVPLFRREDLRRKNRLGSGAFGNVVAGTLSDASVAVKTARPWLGGTDAERAAYEDRVHFEFALEKVVCSFLRALPNKECVSEFLGVIEDPAGADPPELVFAFHYHGQLERYVEGHAAELMADPPLLVRWLADMAAGVASLHAHSIVHYDVHLRNFLVSSDKRVLLSDFGLARHESCDFLDDLFPFVEMPCRLSGPAVDTFTLGRCWYLLLTGGRGANLKNEWFNGEEKRHLTAAERETAAEEAARALSALPAAAAEVKGTLQAMLSERPPDMAAVAQTMKRLAIARS
jgi:hypothetical protein